MSNNERFDAALRAHAFHRPFLDTEGDMVKPAVESAASAPSNRVASAAELEASLLRGLNRLAVGLRPPPKKLLPDTPSSPPPVVEAAPPAPEERPASPYAPQKPPPPATSAGTAAAGKEQAAAPPPERPVSPYAPPPRRPPEEPPAAVTAARQAGRAAAPLMAVSAAVARPAAAPRPASGTAAPSPTAGLAAIMGRPVPKRPGSRILSALAQSGPLPSAGLGQADAAPLSPTVAEDAVQSAASPPPGVAAVPPGRDESFAPPPGVAAGPPADAGPQAGDGDAAPSAYHPEDNDAAEPGGDSPSPEELARLYAPSPQEPGASRRPAAFAAAVSPLSPRRLQRRITAAPGSEPLTATLPGARAGRVLDDEAYDGDPVRERWRDADPGLRNVVLARLGGRNWTAKALAAVVLVALIGGAGAVVTLESLSAPEPQPGTATADRAATGAKQASGKKVLPTRGFAVASGEPPNGVAVIHADDAGGGLAPGEDQPLPGSAKVIPLPQAVPAAGPARRRATADPLAGGGASRPAEAPKVAAAPSDAAAGDAAGGDDGAGASADDPPIAAIRPGRHGHSRGSADGVLAYAPSADPVDGGAKAFLKRGDGKGVGPGLAKVTGWVNMRTSADGKATTIKVLPTGSVVTVVQCKFWCEIVSDGRHGYVYRSFLKRSGDSAAAQ